ncbi:MAG: putative ATP-dependent helicase [Ilumatobacteraceae bacterium]|nr:putative ATP-dependent helicase [Ilumatobacteraceae bacterium]
MTDEVLSPISQHDAEEALREVLVDMAGSSATARDGQADAVVELVTNRGRVLVVQATGWGKSAVYWAATRANRAAGRGPTLVVSPLLALMRDQIDAAARAGVTAATINSTNHDDWDAVYERMRANTIDVILISPERLASPSFTAKLGELTGRLGLVVIDEAHCISDWGHDFRPDYQRIATVLLNTPGVPVLATTATANARVTTDVAGQLGTDTRVIRGSLARSSLRLDSLPGMNAIERWAWVSGALGQIPGSGIVYALTVAEAERLAGFLQSAGHDAVSYTGQHDADTRAEVERRLQANDVKAVVATSALGMGYDKGDLAFCIHVGSPSSPVAMYQQVGRAGRAIDDAVAILLPAETDERLWEYFATVGIPDPALAAQVLEQLASGAASLPSLEQSTGARRGRIEALLRVLSVDGAVVRRGQGWEATGRPWTFDAAKYATLRAGREVEAEMMRTYARKQACLMQQLQLALDDPEPAACGRCGFCTGRPVVGDGTPAAEDVDAARLWMRGSSNVVEPRKMWPSGVNGRKGRITGADQGRAIAFADDPAWPEVIGEVAAGHAGEESLAGALRVLGQWRREWPERPTLVVPLPGPDGGRYAVELAEAIGAAGKLPVADVLEWSGRPASSDGSSGARLKQLIDRLTLGQGNHVDGVVLLVAGTYRSGWTATLAAALLRSAGATRVLPLVAHQQP